MTSSDTCVHVIGVAVLSDDDMIYAQYREAGVLMGERFTLQQFVDQCVLAT